MFLTLLSPKGTRDAVATAALGLAVVAAGGRVIDGTATAGLGVGTAATGTVALQGSANAGLGVGTAAAGAVRMLGQGSAPLGVGMLAVARVLAQASATAPLGISASATARARVAASATAPLGLSATGTARSTIRGPATAPLGLGTTGAGAVRMLGAATAAIPLQVAAYGRLAVVGSSVGGHQVKTFAAPMLSMGPVDANVVRNNDNVLRTAFNAHDADTSIHVQSGLLASLPATAPDGATYVATNTQDVYTRIGGVWVQTGWARWYGDFFDTTDQAIAAVNTAQIVTLNSTGTVRGVSLASGSRVTVAYAGQYNVMFSVQFRNPLASEQDAYLWLQKNGTAVPDSAGRLTIPPKHGGEDGHTIAAWNANLPLAAGDYVELVVQASSTSVVLETIAPVGSAPRSPSAIVTINRI